jgi:dolichol-phosphate mannosyltransferase
VLCVATVAASVVVRLAYMSFTPLLPEEAYYWNYTQHPALGYLDHPPMVAWLIGAGTAVFGRTELGVRAATLLCWTVTVLCTTRLTRRLAGDAAALVAAMLLSVLPFFLGTGFISMPDAPMTACWAAALMFLERALLAERPWAWCGAGIALGLGLLSKYPIALVGGSAFVFMLVDARARLSLRSVAPYGAALLAAALFTPVIVWNSQHEWISFTYQSAGRIAKQRFDLHSYVGAVLFAATPLGVLAAWRGLRPAGPAGGGLDERARRFCLVFTAVPLLVFAAASLRAQTRINWPGPPLLAAIPAMSLAIVGARRDAAGRLERWTAKWVAPTAVCGVAGFVLLAQAVTAGIPGVPFLTAWGPGWKPLAVQVAAMDADLTREEGTRPVVVGLDRNRLASVLAYYDPDPAHPFDVATANVLGDEGMMYDVWNPPEHLRGRSMVIVAEREDDVSAKRVTDRFQSIGDVRSVDIEAGGRLAGRWYVRIGHGYRPPRRRPAGRAGPPAPAKPR